MHAKVSCQETLLIIKQLVAPALLFLVVITPVPGFTSPSEASQAYWIWGGVIPSKASSANELYVYQGVFRNINANFTYRFEGLPPHPIGPTPNQIILTYRLEELIPPEMVVSRFVAHRIAWENAGAEVGGIQIDYDSPTARLLEYADWLVRLQNSIGSRVSVSITGLGDWLASAPPNHLRTLSQKVLFIAFMMYHGSKPLPRLETYTKRLETLSLPFKLGRLEIQKQIGAFKNISQAQGFRGEIVFLHSKGTLR